MPTNLHEKYGAIVTAGTLYPNGSNSFRNQHTSALLNDGRVLVVGWGNFLARAGSG
jgi:hypothetical protein